MDREIVVTPASETRARAATLALVTAAAAVVVGLTLVTVFESLPLSVQFVPLVASVLLVGLPHGAVDHLVIPRTRGEPATLRWIAAIGLLYLVLGGAYLVLWFLEPTAAFVGFLFLTVVHWGQGDVYALVELVGVDHLRTRFDRLLALFVRGGTPIVVPLVAFPDQYAFVAGTIVGAFDSDAAPALAAAFDPMVRGAIGAVFVTLVIASLVRGFRRADSIRSWLIDVTELGSLVVFFASVPPILAIGLYFSLWHSVRHVLRAMLVDDRASAAIERGDVRAASVRFARDAAPLTAGAVVIVAGLALLVPRTPTTVPEGVAVYLVTLAALTLPHAVVVSALDREQRLWSV
ncbi:Brp/Blh family beta-carotene 15,15'-dioxygenase [Natrarchaeobius oligotrophus]|uniref:Probable beta-carotene 15,15'-dioxygenase n=1 Tax=Natrarchaeobius chitinivorans TaxID=1679083 RepID=A0A3N6MY61_NATCH|nr:Brp/Blh family beta-carotene 15,15'-dioxygenase [Natrarchaeobius chitinivorans]RQH01392.1 beta-carotene 15,15'-monooxygenase [Natrarchaeobius chitinivorans]